MCIIYSLDPPEINITGTSTPAVEFTERNITCTTSGGNPSDPTEYKYDWMYKPTYADSTAYVRVPSGKFGQTILLG